MRKIVGWTIKKMKLFLFIFLCLFIFYGTVGEIICLVCAFGVNTDNADPQKFVETKESNSANAVIQKNDGKDEPSLSVDKPKTFSDFDYSHYLKFYQIRYSSENQGPLLPLGLVEIVVTSGNFFLGVENYKYSFVGNIHADNFLFRDGCKYGPYISDHVVALEKFEIERLFDKYGQGDGKCIIRRNIIQRDDIEKLHKILTLGHPEWYKNGFEIKYGVQTDFKGNAILDKNKLAFKDSSDLEYQQGKTIVIPATLSDDKENNFFLNFNNPTAREYAVRYCLKSLSLNKDKLLFIDGVGFSYRQYRNQNRDRTFYICEGNDIEQIHRYADQYADILKEIKHRSGAKIILNGLIDRDSEAISFYERLCSGTNANYFDGVMIENRFWFDDDWFLLPSWGKVNPHDYDLKTSNLERRRWCTNISFYLDWIDRFKKKNKKVLFAACVWPPMGTREEFSKDSPLIYNIWLWYHLIADENTYFYLSPDYIGKVVNYTVYDFPLGRPLSRPYEQENKWFREYQRGTIMFDTTYGELNDIKFVAR